MLHAQPSWQFEQPPTDSAERYQINTVEVDEHSTESVGGIKTVESLGALKLLSAGPASLAAVDDLHMATGRDLNLVVGRKHNATAGCFSTPLCLGRLI